MGSNEKANGEPTEQVADAYLFFEINPTGQWG